MIGSAPYLRDPTRYFAQLANGGWSGMRDDLLLDSLQENCLCDRALSRRGGSVFICGACKGSSTKRHHCPAIIQSLIYPNRLIALAHCVFPYLETARPLPIFGNREALTWTKKVPICGQKILSLARLSNDLKYFIFYFSFVVRCRNVTYR